MLPATVTAKQLQTLVQNVLNWLSLKKQKQQQPKQKQANLEDFESSPFNRLVNFLSLKG